ncbi:Para-nitrobenzyl esterase [Arthrobacter saudimassiliensis]|uniref:Carboxylic ester hydrolase n=1 Tax=Arthrobacter saudimassiliensis TaxID=1461584 RepID=A0A078MT85_9MICC|nr:Para-nitrobenzyl esterase [Arthrobacter saudimassiliensis]
MTPATESLVVHTAEGPVRGSAADGVRSWRGIPYAQPPVGRLRLRDPQPAEPWSQVRDATADGPVPPQRRVSVHLGAGRRTPVSEDCLTLNVSAPDRPETPVGLPVVVWLYGGAFTAGAGSVPGYRGDALVRRGDVVFVTLNYRLGALGFFDFRHLGAAERPFDANVGLKDQVAALQWIQRNIAAFGGDPGNVTLAGESAGGVSITTLMCVPAAAGLFHRGFALSSAPAAALDEVRARWRADRLLALLDVAPRDADAARRALEELSWRALVAAAARLSDDIVPDEDPGTLAAAPVVDGSWLPEDPVSAFRAGRQHPVPLVLGTMAAEGTLFDKLHDILPTSAARIDKMLGGADPAARQRLLDAYPGYPGKPAAVALGADSVFWHPSLQLAEAHSARAGTWMYRFDYAPRLLRLLGFGATHGSELPAFFDTYDSGLGRFLTSAGGRASARNVAVSFQGALLRFVRTDDPGPMWPRYTAVERRTRIFNVRGELEMDPRRVQRQAWQALSDED